MLSNPLFSQVKLKKNQKNDQDQGQQALAKKGVSYELQNLVGQLKIWSQ